tara:strand:- start:1035 stop:1172 length:138 start_codon:yes stop_codon:yes gene_type:complete
MRQEVSRSKIKADYMVVMFPYNESKNFWISGIEEVEHQNYNNFLI